ncbi:hypothetical protein [Streptomyces sp. SGAir0957]
MNLHQPLSVRSFRRPAATEPGPPGGETPDTPALGRTTLADPLDRGL